MEQSADPGAESPSPAFTWPAVRVRRLFGRGMRINFDHEAPGYNRSRSRIQAIRIRNPSRPAARGFPDDSPGRACPGQCCHRAKRAGGLLRIVTPGRGWRRIPVAPPSFDEFPTLLQIPIIPIYHPLPIQPNWPSRVRLPLQSRHRPGTRRSGHRVRFRAGVGSIRFVRGAGRRPTRCGARMRYVPGIRARSRRAGDDRTERGRAARLRGGSTWTRSPAGRAVQPLVPARCSPQR